MHEEIALFSTRDGALCALCGLCAFSVASVFKGLIFAGGKARRTINLGGLGSVEIFATRKEFAD